MTESLPWLLFLAWGWCAANIWAFSHYYPDRYRRSAAWFLIALTVFQALANLTEILDLKLLRMGLLAGGGVALLIYDFLTFLRLRKNLQEGSTEELIARVHQAEEATTVAEYERELSQRRVERLEYLLRTTDFPGPDGT